MTYFMDVDMAMCQQIASETCFVGERENMCLLSRNGRFAQISDDFYKRDRECNGSTMVRGMEAYSVRRRQWHHAHQGGAIETN